MAQEGFTALSIPWKETWKYSKPSTTSMKVTRSDQTYIHSCCYGLRGTFHMVQTFTESSFDFLLKITEHEKLKWLVAPTVLDLSNNSVDDPFSKEIRYKCDVMRACWNTLKSMFGAEPITYPWQVVPVFSHALVGQHTWRTTKVQMYQKEWRLWCRQQSKACFILNDISAC